MNRAKLIGMKRANLSRNRPSRASRSHKPKAMKARRDGQRIIEKAEQETDGRKRTARRKPRSAAGVRGLRAQPKGIPRLSAAGWRLQSASPPFPARPAWPGERPRDRPLDCRSIASESRNSAGGRGTEPGRARPDSVPCAQANRPKAEPGDTIMEQPQRRRARRQTSGFPTIGWAQKGASAGSMSVLAPLASGAQFPVKARVHRGIC